MDKVRSFTVELFGGVSTAMMKLDKLVATELGNIEIIQIVDTFYSEEINRNNKPSPKAVIVRVVTFRKK